MASKAVNSQKSEARSTSGRHHEKIRRHGKVHTLPPEIRKEVDDLLTSPGITYEDIEEYLKSKGFDIGKSSIGRYGKDFLAQYQRLRIIEDQARTLVSESGDGLILDEAGGKLMARRIIEILSTQDVDLKDVSGLAMGLSSLIKANVSREKFKADLKKKVEKVFEKAEKKKESMSKEEMLQWVKEQVYGLA